MFQISTLPVGRSTASALSVLAAIGASGMAAQATADPVTLDPSMAARTKNSSYAYMPANWEDWLAATGWSNMGVKADITSRGFTKWNIDFGAGSITGATFRIHKNNESSSYGVPPGMHMEFSLITDPWDSATPKPSDPDGPDIDPSTTVSVAAPSGLLWEADITGLLQAWQANPSAYHGIRWYSPDSGGGVTAQNNTEAGRAGITADLVLTQQQIPEPGALSVLAAGGLFALRRRRRC